ncbi:hypothetical protein EON81_14185 [bacterium]|nr:MAG: hypothetical protein EON81_14185 [bacterium]
MAEILRKQLEFKGTLEENRLRCVASTTGNADRYGDVIAAGAFAPSVLKRYIKEGFVTVGHAWDLLPIGYPMEAGEAGNELIIESEFHTTDDAQKARTVVKERTAAKKSVGISIGFMPDYKSVQYFSTGEALIEWATGKGMDPGQFDKAIPAHKGGLRFITKIEELFEHSIVTVPANRGANRAEAKSFTPAELREYVEGLGLKSLANSVGQLLQAKIHQGFTVAADEVAIRGYMSTDERIALSKAISVGLNSFRDAMDPAVADRLISAEDVDHVAAKAAADAAKARGAQMRAIALQLIDLPDLVSA